MSQSKTQTAAVLPPLSSPAALVDRAREALPRELVAADDYARLQAMARRLPPTIMVGLECRLLPTSEAVDMWICPGLTAPDLAQSSAWLRQTGWPSFAPLADRLEQQRPPWPLSAGVWTIEFDLASWDEGQPLSLPSSFVTFSHADPPLDAEAVISELWQGERGQAMDSAELRQLRLLLQRCPSGELAGWGFLYPRAHTPARLMLRVAKLEELADLLGEHLHLAQRLLEGLTYQVVIGTPLYYEQERRQSLEAYISSPSAWQELARRLVAQQYSTEAKAQALLELALHPIRTEGALTTLNHVKMAIKENGQAEVKAYPSIFGLPL